MRIGVGMIVAALTGGVLVVAGVPARGDEAATPAPQPLTITKQAYYTYSLGAAVPRILASRFPPQAVCLVIAPACGTQLQPLTGPVNQLVQSNPPDKVVPVEPVQPLVPSGTLPSSVMAGARRYESAIKFDVPTLPGDQKFKTFVVQLKETQPTFHADSPLFRHAVLAFLAAIESAAAGKPPPQDEFLGALAEQPITDRFVGVEACMILTPFSPGPNQPATAAPTDAKLNCVLGANGRRDANGIWSFDLTLAANAWVSGAIPNEGIILRPIAPPNLAYGDADLSSFEQVTFVGAGQSGAPMVAMATESKPKPVEFRTLPSSPPVAPPLFVEGVQATASGPQTFTETIPGTEGVTTPVALGTTPAPSVGRSIGLAAPASKSSPVTEWWVWLLVPLLLGGVWLTTQALTAEAAVAVDRSGAMSRLIARRRAEAALYDLHDR